MNNLKIFFYLLIITIFFHFIVEKIIILCFLFIIILALNYFNDIIENEVKEKSIYLYNEIKDFFTFYLILYKYIRTYFGIYIELIEKFIFFFIKYNKIINIKINKIFNYIIFLKNFYFYNKFLLLEFYKKFVFLNK